MNSTDAAVWLSKNCKQCCRKNCWIKDGFIEGDIKRMTFAKFGTGDCPAKTSELSFDENSWLIDVTDCPNIAQMLQSKLYGQDILVALDKLASKNNAIQIIDMLNQLND